MSTTQNCKPSPGQPSAKLARMLKDATPQQRAAALKTTANLLAIKAKKAQAEGLVVSQFEEARAVQGARRSLTVHTSS